MVRLAITLGQKLVLARDLLLDMAEIFEVTYSGGKNH